MKRAKLIDRVALLVHLEEELVNAGTRYAKTAQDSMAQPHQRENARRELLQAATALGLVFKRYLGGRSE